MYFKQCHSKSLAPWRKMKGGLMIFDEIIKRISASNSSLLTASTIPAIQKPFLITLFLFWLTSAVLLYCKYLTYFGRLFWFYFRIPFCPRLKSSQCFATICIQVINESIFPTSVSSTWSCKFHKLIKRGMTSRGNVFAFRGSARWNTCLLETRICLILYEVKKLNIPILL